MERHLASANKPGHLAYWDFMKFAADQGLRSNTPYDEPGRESQGYSSKYMLAYQGRAMAGYYDHQSGDPFQSASDLALNQFRMVRILAQEGESIAAEEPSVFDFLIETRDKLVRLFGQDYPAFKAQAFACLDALEQPEYVTAR